MPTFRFTYEGGNTVKRIVFDSTSGSQLRQNALSLGYCALKHALALPVQAVGAKPIQPCDTMVSGNRQRRSSCGGDNPASFSSPWRQKTCCRGSRLSESARWPPRCSGGLKSLWRSNKGQWRPTESCGNLSIFMAWPDFGGIWMRVVWMLQKASWQKVSESRVNTVSTCPLLGLSNRT
jgi:hypothetical protein